jgi:hypothetical protein
LQQDGEDTDMNVDWLESDQGEESSLSQTSLEMQQQCVACLTCLAVDPDYRKWRSTFRKCKDHWNKNKDGPFSAEMIKYAKEVQIRETDSGMPRGKKPINQVGRHCDWADVVRAWEVWQQNGASGVTFDHRRVLDDLRPGGGGSRRTAKKRKGAEGDSVEAATTAVAAVMTEPLETLPHDILQALSTAVHTTEAELDSLGRTAEELVRRSRSHTLHLRALLSDSDDDEEEEEDSNEEEEEEEMEEDA